MVEKLGIFTRSGWNLEEQVPIFLFLTSPSKHKLYGSVVLNLNEILREGPCTALQSSCVSSEWNVR